MGLQAADDDTVWTYAADHGFVIVSKDADFHQRSFVLGHPPKVVWIRRGNCSTAEIEEIFGAHQADLLAFEQDEQGGFSCLAENPVPPACRLAAGGRDHRLGSRSSVTDFFSQNPYSRAAARTLRVPAACRNGAVANSPSATT